MSIVLKQHLGIFFPFALERNEFKMSLGQIVSIKVFALSADTSEHIPGAVL